MQNIFNNETITQLQIIHNQFGLFKDIIWTIIFIFAVIGFVLWLANNKYHSLYQLEKPSKPEFLANLVAEGVEGGFVGLNVFSYLIQSLKFSLIFLITIVLLTYSFLGINWVFFLFFLAIMTWFNTNIIMSKILINDGLKNDNYISTPILLNSIGKMTIGLLEPIFSKKINLKILIFIIITLVLFLTLVEFFYYWALIWIVVYFLKILVLNYKIKLMVNPPLFVNVEYSNGNIDEKLILYQTTSTDYRFKKKSSDEEFIIPITSIKKIHLNYNHKLLQLNQILEVETLNFDHSDHPLLKKFPKKILPVFDKIIISDIIKLKPKTWYQKAVIYSKMQDFENAETSLGEAIKLDKSFINIAKDDIDLINIQNKKWFQDLLKINENISDESQI